MALALLLGFTGEYRLTSLWVWGTGFEVEGSRPQHGQGAPAKPLELPSGPQDAKTAPILTPNRKPYYMTPYCKPYANLLEPKAVNCKPKIAFFHPNQTHEKKPAMDKQEP